MRAVRSGLIDAVQVIYNIFDQNPEDELFPACREMDVAVIARVPFDEGTLTGTLTKGEHLARRRLAQHLFRSGESDSERGARRRASSRSSPQGMTMPEMALRFILTKPTVSTIIPGMRKLAHVESNIAASDAGPLPPELQAQLKEHRWDRQPKSWSQ